MATVSIPYPAQETAESIRVYALVENDWLRVEDVRVNKNQQTLEFKADRLTRFRLAIPKSKPWDPNRDARVDIFDLVAVANDFGQSIYDNLNSVGNRFGQTGTNVEDDLNGDGEVNILDLVAMAKQTFHSGIYADLGMVGTEFGQVSGSLSNDLNGDGQVDIFDLVSAARKRKPKLIGDINEDGYVDVFDLALIAIHFGEKYELDGPAIATAPAIVQRQAQGWVSLNHGSADKSSMISLSLTAQLAEVLKGYQFTLSYDPALLSVLQIQDGDAFDGDGFGFEPQSMDAGQAKFAAVNLSRLEPAVSQIGREMVLAEVIVQIHGEREQALSSIGLEEVVLSNPQGIRIPVLSQQSKPEPEEYQLALAQNYPNPFNPETWIPYHLSVDSQVEISIYDSAGKLVRRLDIGLQSAGNYESQNRAAYWDGKNKLGEQVASGVYFYTIQAGEFADTRKMLLMK